MQSKAIRSALANIHQLKDFQLQSLVEDVDIGISGLKSQMEHMSAQYKFKTIPILRDLNTLRKRAVAEIERRTK